MELPLSRLLAGNVQVVVRLPRKAPYYFLGTALLPVRLPADPPTSVRWLPRQLVVLRGTYSGEQPHKLADRIDF
jgi:hypothetical protein